VISRYATHFLIRTQEARPGGPQRNRLEERALENLNSALAPFSEILAPIEIIDRRWLTRILSPRAASENVLDEALRLLAQIPGVVAVAPCIVTSLEPSVGIQNITEAAQKLCEDFASVHSTYAVRTRRLNKRFPLTSSAIDTAIASALWTQHPQWKTDLDNPEVTLHIEVRTHCAILWSREERGQSGLLIDPNQRVLCLISGGLDSTVAALRILRQGCLPVLVHFHSTPAQNAKSTDRCAKLQAFFQRISPQPIELWKISFLKIQQQIRDSVGPEWRTEHYRRFMWRISALLAEKTRAQAIVTGEVLSQSNGQRLPDFTTAQELVRIPLLRPVLTSSQHERTEEIRQTGIITLFDEQLEDLFKLFVPNEQYPATRKKQQKPTQSQTSAILNAQSDLMPTYRWIYETLDEALAKTPVAITTSAELSLH